MPQGAYEVQLKQETLQGFEAYVREMESEMGQSLRLRDFFLWAESDPQRARKIREGQVIAEFWSGRGPVSVPNGLIHDWVGAAWMPGTTLKDTLDLIQDYDNHANIYRPEVIASKLLNRRGHNFEIYLRLLKKKIITVVLDTEHSVLYRPAGRNRWTCRSYTTRIAEVENAGTPAEKILAPDTGYGFLWRLNSYWRFQECAGGVDMQCRAISLTRNVPLGLGWLIEPIIQELPKESLIRTLDCTRQAVGRV